MGNVCGGYSGTAKCVSWEELTCVGGVRGTCNNPLAGAFFQYVFLRTKPACPLYKCSGCFDPHCGEEKEVLLFQDHPEDCPCSICGNWGRGQPTGPNSSAEADPPVDPDTDFEQPTWWKRLCRITPLEFERMYHGRWDTDYESYQAMRETLNPKAVEAALATLAKEGGYQWVVLPKEAFEPGPMIPKVAGEEDVSAADEAPPVAPVTPTLVGLDVLGMKAAGQWMVDLLRKYQVYLEEFLPLMDRHRLLRAIDQWDRATGQFEL